MTSLPANDKNAESHPGKLSRAPQLSNKRAVTLLASRADGRQSGN